MHLSESGFAGLKDDGIRYNFLCSPPESLILSSFNPANSNSDKQSQFKANLPEIEIQRTAQRRIVELYVFLALGA